MDKLKTPAPQFYTGNVACIKKLNSSHKGLDDAGKFLLHEACHRDAITEAKKCQYRRRTAPPPSITRREGKMYIENFEQLGPRWVKDACDVYPPRDGHIGGYTDTRCDELLIGVICCFTRHGEGENNYEVHKAKGRVIYMAGTRHSDWEGVTLDLDTTDDPDTAARWADRMAEREAEEYREADEIYQAEQKREDLRCEIKSANHFTGRTARRDAMKFAASFI